MPPAAKLFAELTELRKSEKEEREDSVSKTAISRLVTLHVLT